MESLSRYLNKIKPDIESLKCSVEELRKQSKKIVLTSGTFDMLHVGHERYLSLARQFGDALIVGVDSDAKVKKRKGPSRPIVEGSERVEMLSYLECVDVLFVKQVDDPQWDLIKMVQPNILIISTRSEYSEHELEVLSQYCGSVQVLESQAETSTTARIRNLLVSQVAPLQLEIDQLESKIRQVQSQLRKIIGGSS